MSAQLVDLETKRFDQNTHQITVTVGRIDTTPIWGAANVEVRTPGGSQLPQPPVRLVPCDSKEEALANGLTQGEEWASLLNPKFRLQ